MCAPTPAVAQPDAYALHARFLALLPRVERHARLSFRDVRCPSKRDDCVAEAIALSWKWFTELARRGKDAAAFVTVLAGFAARAVRCGRRLAGQERARDVLSSIAQRRHGFAVERLPTSTRVAFEHLYATPGAQEKLDALEECLHDNTVTPVADQAAFRIDFPAWRNTHTERDRRVIDDLMVGSRTQEVAQRFGLSESRVSQLRRAFAEDWRCFCGDVDDEMDRVPAQAERRL